MQFGPASITAVCSESYASHLLFIEAMAAAHGPPLSQRRWHNHAVDFGMPPSPSMRALPPQAGEVPAKQAEGG